MYLRHKHMQMRHSLIIAENDLQIVVTETTLTHNVTIKGLRD